MHLACIESDAWSGPDPTLTGSIYIYKKLVHQAYQTERGVDWYG